MKIEPPDLPKTSSAKTTQQIDTRFIGLCYLDNPSTGHFGADTASGPHALLAALVAGSGWRRPLSDPGYVATSTARAIAPHPGGPSGARQ